MDYELAALKLFCCELRGAKQQQQPQQQALSLFSIQFQRAWLQGVIVASSDKDNGRLLLLDDGTDVVELTVPPSLAPSYWKPGMYVMAVGRCCDRPNAAAPAPAPAPPPPPPSLLAHKMVDLSSQPHREAMWNLEVVEAHHLFYLHSNTISSVTGDS